MSRAEIEGMDQLQAELGRLSREAQAGVDKAVQATGLEVRGDIVKRIQRGPASGQVYDSIFRMINGRAVPIGPRAGNNLSPTHQASAPGEAPASDTGALARSINYKREGAMSASVGSDLAYAAMLEFGTKNIEPRPAWIPALEDARPKYLRRLEKAISEAMK